MSTNKATFGVAITADDKTAKGAASAERRLSGMARRAADGVGRYESALGRAGGRSTLGAIGAATRTFGQVERAMRGVVGASSGLGGMIPRLGAISEAGAAAGTGLGEAAASGGLVASSLGLVTAAAATTAGVVVGVAYATDKLVGSWAKGVAGAAQLADTIGMSTQALQKFQGAAERVGVDKGTAAGALTGLAGTLDDARYGRNNAALAVLMRMGVKLRQRADGTVDTEAMMPAIADALARQNSSGRRTAARALGIDLAALPAFTQGGKALSADMADVGRYGAVSTQGEIDKARSWRRRRAMAGQMAERGYNAGVATVADTTGGALDGAVAAGRALTDGSASLSSVVSRDFAPASRTLLSAATALASGVAAQPSGLVHGRLSAQQAAAKARRGVPLRNKLMRAGFSAEDATALAANAMMESDGDHRSRERGGAGRGLWQWTDKARKNNFRRVMGVDVEHSTEDQQIAFLKWELGHTEKRTWAQAHARGRDAGSVADGFARWVERPAERERDGAERRMVANAMPQPIPVKVEIEMRGAPLGTHAKVTAGHGSPPAISHAMPH